MPTCMLVDKNTCLISLYIQRDTTMLTVSQQILLRVDKRKVVMLYIYSMHTCYVYILYIQQKQETQFPRSHVIPQNTEYYYSSMSCAPAVLIAAVSLDCRLADTSKYLLALFCAIATPKLPPAAATIAMSLRNSAKSNLY